MINMLKSIMAVVILAHFSQHICVANLFSLKEEKKEQEKGTVLPLEILLRNEFFLDLVVFLLKFIFLLFQI